MITLSGQTRCSRCGNQQPEESRFCAYCGARLETEGTPRAEGGAPEPADFWPRLGAFAVDGIVASAFLSFLVLLIWLLSSIGASAGVIAAGFLVAGAYVFSSAVLFPVRAVVWAPPYHAVTIGLWGRTPAMRWLGLTMITQEGRRPTWLTALRRAAASYVSFVLYLGYLRAAWDPQRQTWHDKIADAMVVFWPPPGQDDDGR